MLTRFQRKKLNESIEILDVFRHYNIRLLNDSSGRMKCTCPFHFDRSPSLKIYPRNNSWYSFCCGKGTTAWDFIKLKEGDFEEAEKVLKELATIDLPDDPLDCLSIELREKKEEEVSEKINQLAYSLGITLRDFLKNFQKDKEKYKEVCSQIDNFYLQIDDLLDLEDLELQELEVLQNVIEEYMIETLQIWSKKCV